MVRTSRAPRVIVITGASSGIGLATARAAARRRDHVVLAARSVAGLERAATDCRALGGEALVVPTDVSRAGDVAQLAAAAVAHFGAIDAWVNNAGVAAFGRFEELPPADVERVIATNVTGYAWGSQEAIRCFRRQGHGTLVNVASANGRIASPFTTAYVLTKFANLGLTQSLRLELDDEPDIHVCGVLPASVDTPLYQHAANYTGRSIGPAGPAFSPDRVADAVLRCIDDGRREVKVGWTGVLAQVLQQVSGPLYERGASLVFPPSYARRGDVAPHAGNLHAPGPPTAQAVGGWARDPGLPVSRRVLGIATAATGVVAAIATALGSRRRAR